MQGLFIALGVVFVAELGDKTQLVVLTMGARQRVWAALAGLGATIILLQALAVSVGAAIASVVPETAIGIGAGLLFVGFAVWTWLSAGSETDEETDASEEAATRSRGVLGMCAAFFVAELGDKTQLTSAALAADYNPIATWVGASLGLFGATAVALFAGRFLAGRVPPTLFARLGAIAFAIVGVITLIATIRG